MEKSQMCKNCWAWQAPFSICRNCNNKWNYDIIVTRIKQKPNKKAQKQIKLPRKTSNINDVDWSNNWQKCNKAAKVLYKDLKELSRHIARSLKSNQVECELCWGKNNLQVHHIDKNPFNNSADNLVKLCLPCHAEAHKGEQVYNIMI